MMKCTIFFFMILGIFAIANECPCAATIVVSEATDAALRSAVANAAPGDTINFAPVLFANGPVEIYLNGTIVIEKNLSIIGPENASLLILRCNNTHFVIGHPNYTRYVLLKNFKLLGGQAIGGAGETLCTGGGGGAGLGGAIYINIHGYLTCQNVTFEKNIACGGNGGGSGAYWQVNGGAGGNASSPYFIILNDFHNYVWGTYSGGYGGNVGNPNYNGGDGGYACGGGGGVGERFLVNNASLGGEGGWGGGGGGGGGGGSSCVRGRLGGEFGGTGGSGTWTGHGGGGGGAGLGGAIFVDSEGVLILENCVFLFNQANGGVGLGGGENGHGKGGAIFVRKDGVARSYNSTFLNNIASSASGGGFTSGVHSDTMDVYGIVTEFTPPPTPTPTPIPILSLQVTTTQDENDGLSQGTGVSLREALQTIGNGGQIDIAESILPATLKMDSALGQFIIEKNVKIKAPENKTFIVDGNQGRVFFIKSGHLYLENMKIVNALARGGNGGNGGCGTGGGAAGIGGAVFINTNAVLSAIHVQFAKCMAQGGNGGNPIDGYYGGGGGGIGGDGSSGINGYGNGGSGWPLSSRIAVFDPNSISGSSGSDGGGGAGSHFTYGGGNGGFGGGGGGGRVFGSGKGGFGGGSGGGYRNERSQLTFNPGGTFGGGAFFCGGGGAGLGGALFVREGGSLLLDSCEFENNAAVGGSPGYSQLSTSSPGQGKGGAIFAMENAIAKVRDCTFIDNSAANSAEGEGFTYFMLSDTPDVYGVLTDLSDGDISAFPSDDATPTPTPIGEEIPTPTVTPTPYATPTPEIQPTPVLQPEFIRYDFSGANADENDVTLQGAGFGAYPQADVSFGYLPTDNAFEGATDGQGVIVQADPGEGVMIFGGRVETNYAAMIRCSVRTEQGHAAVTIATIGDKPDRFVATNSPADETYFAGQYQRLSVFYTPPSTGFQPVVQIVNTSKTETLTAYLDNLEIYPLNPDKYYSAAFLDNDTFDPPLDKISIPPLEDVGDIDDPFPAIPADFKAVPHPGSNTKIDLSWSFSETHQDYIHLQRSTTGLNNDWSQVFIFSPSEQLNISFIDFDLSPNTLYYYRLLVLNEISGYFAYSEPVSVRTNP